MKRSARFVFGICLALILVLNLSVYAAPKTNLRFMWWGGESRHKATIDAIELYTKKNPNVKIEGEYGGFTGYQQKLLTQLAGGTAADIIQIDQPWMGELMSRGDMFADLNKLKDIDLSTFDKNFLENQCQWENKLIGLPTGLNGLSFFANTSFFARHNIPLDINWDWEKLIEIGTRIHKQNKSNYLLTMDISHMQNLLKMYMLQHNGSKDWVNENFTLGFDKKDLTEAFSYYLRLIETGTIPPLEETVLLDSKTEQNPRWISGDIGIAQNWASSVSLFKLDGKIKLDVVSLPLLKKSNNTGILVRPSQLMVINKRSSNVKEAAKFVNWFFNDPEAILILKSERGIPSTNLATKLLEENKLIDPIMAKGINLAMKDAGLPENSLTTNKELITIFGEYIQQVGFKRLTPAKAADQMMRSYQLKLKELKAQQ